MKRLTRLTGLGIVCLVMLTLVVGVASAQEVVLVVGYDQWPGQLYPLTPMVQAGTMEEFYARDVWNWDKDNNIYPVMAAEIPTFENGGVTTNDAGNTVVTVHLREGMLWSDGEPITSDDCLFYHEVAMDPAKSANLQRGNYNNVVESAEAIDDLTFQVAYNQPWPDYQSDSYVRCSYPAHILRPVLEAEGTIDNAPQFSGENVVSYGPFMITEWVADTSATLERNPNWDGQSPAIDRIILQFIPDSAQMQSSVETGEVDFAFLWGDDLYVSYQALPGVTVWQDPWVLNDAVWINVTEKAHPALQDVNVRQALFYAMDRRAMADGLVGPQAVIPTLWWNSKWDPGTLDPRSFDQARANQLLDDAGWVDSNGDGTRDKDGMEFILRFFTTPRQVRIDYQTLIQEYLGQVGIGVQIFQAPAGVLFAPWSQRGILLNYDYDLAIFGSTNSPLSPNTSAGFACDQVASAEHPDGFNNAGWCDPEFDEVDAQSNTIVDPAERLALVQENIQRWYDAAFYIGLYVRGTNYALNSDRFNAETFMGGGRLSLNYFQNAELWQPAG
jgi:peptide/nickel transport system substrate-binding protein